MMTSKGGRRGRSPYSVKVLIRKRLWYEDFAFQVFGCFGLWAWCCSRMAKRCSENTPGWVILSLVPLSLLMGAWCVIFGALIFLIAAVCDAVAWSWRSLRPPTRIDSEDW
jgi:hypothetical protein